METNYLFTILKTIFFILAIYYLFHKFIYNKKSIIGNPDMINNENIALVESFNTMQNKNSGHGKLDYGFAKTDIFGFPLQQFQKAFDGKSKTPLYTYNLELETVAKPLLIGSGKDAQTYHTFVNYLSGLYPIINSESNGSYQNIKDLINRKIEFGLCQEDLVLSAREGSYPFSDKNQPQLEFVCGLFYEYFILITKESSGIKSWKDLKGKKLGLPSKDSGSYYNAMILSNAVELVPNKDYFYKNVNSVNRLFNLFQQDEFDAIYVTTNTKNPFIVNIAQDPHLRFVGTDGIEKDTMKFYFPHAYEKQLNTNDFNPELMNRHFINTYAVRTVLVSHKETPEIRVYNILKVIFQNVDKLKFKLNEFLHSQNRNNLMRDALIPSDMFRVHHTFAIHKGAEKYYKEVGYIKEHIVYGEIKKDDIDKLEYIDNEV